MYVTHTSIDLIGWGGERVLWAFAFWEVFVMR